MALRDQVTHAFVNSGEQLSTLFSIRGAREVGVWAPVVTSCQAFPHVSFDTTSANMARAGKLDGTGDFTWSIGAGSKYQFIEAFRGGREARLELSVTQAAPRSFMVITKF